MDRFIRQREAIFGWAKNFAMIGFEPLRDQSR
jgi:hypothetical protein